MRTYQDMNLKELNILEEEYEKQVSDLNDKIKAIQDEISARSLGIRVGDEFEFEGTTYKAVKVGYWVEVSWKTKKGVWSQQNRHCYGWKDWKAGRSASPFKSAPWTL